MGFLKRRVYRNARCDIRLRSRSTAWRAGFCAKDGDYYCGCDIATGRDAKSISPPLDVTRIRLWKNPKKSEQTKDKQRSAQSHKIPIPGATEGGRALESSANKRYH